MQALTQQYRGIAHNLANASTGGYKRRISRFLQTLLQTEGSTLGNLGTVESETVIDFTQGMLTRTDRPLDCALQGEGFFVIESPEGVLYTRNGSFHVNPQRQLVDLAGRIISGLGGPITIPSDCPANKVQISAEGTVDAGGTQIGRLRLAEFEDRSVLLPMGSNCFAPPEGVTPTPATGTKVYQGFQEPANLSVVDELVNLITVTRLYEANLKAIQTQDERAKQLLEIAIG
jgi:flagellar basal body rod protein FlgG